MKLNKLNFFLLIFFLTFNLYINSSNKIIKVSNLKKYILKNKFKLFFPSIVIGLSIYKCKNENVNLKDYLFQAKNNTYNFFEKLYLNPKITFNESYIFIKNISFNEILKNSFFYLALAYFSGKFFDYAINGESSNNLKKTFKEGISDQNNLCFFKAIFSALFIRESKINDNDALQVILNKYQESVLNKKFKKIEENKMNFGQKMFSISGFISFNLSNSNKRDDEEINSKDDAFKYMFNKKCLYFDSNEDNDFIKNFIDSIINEEINSEEKFNEAKKCLKESFENKINNIANGNYYEKNIEEVFRDIKYIDKNKEEIRLYKLILEDKIEEINKLATGGNNISIIQSLNQSVKTKSEILNEVIEALNKLKNIEKFEENTFEDINDQIQIVNKTIDQINSQIQPNIENINNINQENIKEKYLENLKTKKDNLFNELKKCFNENIFFLHYNLEYLNYKNIIDKINQQKQNEFTKEEKNFYNQQVKEFEYNETYDNLNQILINNYKLIKVNDFKNVHEEDKQDGIYLKILVPYELTENIKGIVIKKLNIDQRDSQKFNTEDYFNLINGDKNTLKKYKIEEKEYNENKINFFANIKGGTHYTIMYDKDKILDLMNEDICEKFGQNKVQNNLLYYACLSINLEEEIQTNNGNKKTILDIILESSLSEACFEDA